MQDVGRRGDGGSVGARVPDHQQDVLDPSVACLQRQPAEKGLHVVEPGFSIDRQSALTRRQVDEARDPGVPRPQVTRDRKRDLVPDCQARMQSHGEASQELCLGRVPDRIGTRVGVDTDVESDDGPEADELSHACARYESSLQPHDVRRRPIRSFPDETQGQTRADSCIPQLFAESDQITVSQATGPIQWSVSSRHHSSLARRTSLPLNRLWSDDDR